MKEIRAGLIAVLMGLVLGAPVAAVAEGNAEETQSYVKTARRAPQKICPAMKNWKKPATNPAGI